LEFDKVDYNLIAIHTSIEDYRLKVFHQSKLPINLSKSNEEVQIKIKGEQHFQDLIIMIQKMEFLGI
jgi:hypothetical protein